jgi:beta-galactosidase
VLDKNMNKTFYSDSRIHLGAAYYPEHWPEETWGNDIELMHNAGLTVVRMGEFAWSSLEPTPGEFRLEWLERAIHMLASSGIVTVLGTPTAAPPTWLVQQHPDLLAVNEQGQRVQVGNRCHYCVNSPEFHTASQRIVRAMAERYGRNPNVIGWQFDNEYHRVCYCDRCRKLFQQLLQAKYGTLEVLNQRWSTSYWSQTYTSWDQIPLPIGSHNPGLMLEFKHFITISYRDFQRLQVDALRPYIPDGVWMTHNFMKWFDGYDHYTMSEDLDIASWDWYVGTGHHDYLSSGVLHDQIRGFKRRNFWLMETQPGSINWKPINSTLDRGEARAMAWHAVAHGADAILYWQWRSALGGQEQMHGTLVDQSGQPRLFYEEVQQLGKEFAALTPILAGSEIKASVAMLNDYDSLWSIQWQPHHRDFDYIEHFTHYYKPLALLNVPVDILPANGLKDARVLADYKLIIAPALLLQNPATVKILQEYVDRGGHLVLTARSGMKDDTNALIPQRQPGALGKMAGIEVEEYYALQEPVSVKGNWFEGQTTLWAERLALTSKNSAHIIARYGKSNGWLDDRPAITVNMFGSGYIYYVGTYLDDPAQEALITRFLKTARVTIINTAPGIEFRARVGFNDAGDRYEVFIVINHTPTPTTLHLPWPAFEHLTGQNMPDELPLTAYGVAIVTPLKTD